MCGITGYIGRQIEEQQVRESAESLKHRGPDNRSIWMERQVGLGHARLSILDLSDHANQPFHSHCQRFVMVYNGEVYNFQELKEKYRLQTQTTSDSEVILELFVQKGVSFVEELNGMFAIAIFDKKENKLFLFRDRLGIKPLFYFFNGQEFAFASELKALLQYKVVKSETQVNKETIAPFLNLGYLPLNQTFFKYINKFPSGHRGEFDGQSLKVEPFWNLESKLSETTFDNEEDVKTKLRDLLFDSVSKRMVSDVPLGTFLSGGIDSSLVTAVAQKVSPNPVKTFSIGFKESKFNESDYARKVAEHLKTEHTEFIVSQQDVLGLFEDYFKYYDEPYADTSGFPTMMVSQLAKQKVSVILSGDGGDELFHGYGMYNWAERLNNPFLKSFRKPMGMLFGMTHKFSKVSDLLSYSKTDDVRRHIFSQEQFFFSNKEIQNLTGTYLPKDFFPQTKSKRKLLASEKQALFDIQNYLKDDLLVKVDRASMRSSLEVRVPLLDHRLVEFAVNVNPKFKMREGELKYILKQVLYELVPKSYFERPKWGFSIPLEQWMQNELRPLVEEYTSKEMIEKHQVFNYEDIDKLKQQYFSGKTYLYNRIWLILNLHKNLEKYAQILG